MYPFLPVTVCYTWFEGLFLKVSHEALENIVTRWTPLLHLEFQSLQHEEKVFFVVVFRLIKN